MAILTYHHIADYPRDLDGHKGLFVSPALFRQQLAWLKDHGYVSVALDKVLASISGGPPLPKRWVVITFDDGFRDNFNNAYPALCEYGFNAIVFLVTDKVARRESSGAWDDYLTLSDINEMRSGGIEFGSHTHTHPRLTKLESGTLGDAAEINTVSYELQESRRRMTEDLGLEPEWFCYPYGNFSPRIADIVRAAGYRGALSTIRDNRPTAGQEYWLPRVMIMNDTHPRRLSYMLSRTYHWVHAFKNRKRWKSIK